MQWSGLGTRDPITSCVEVRETQTQTKKVPYEHRKIIPMEVDGHESNLKPSEEPDGMKSAAHGSDHRVWFKNHHGEQEPCW